MRRARVFLVVAAVACAAVPILCAWTYAPSHPADIVLGRPTATSITLNALSDGDVQTVVDYGTQATTLSSKSTTHSLKAGVPQEIALSGLSANTRYYYRLCDSGTNATLVEGTFQTQRAPGSAFTFEIMGDSHPERAKQFDPDLYAQMLTSVAADRPDFYVASGDDFSVDTLKSITAESVAQRYSLQRPFLGIVGKSAPVFLVNGNHEQAAAANLNGTANNVAVWAQNSRNAHYSQPAPDSFYSGNSVEVPFIGKLRDYYAWTWGDALFVVIDPYWHSTSPVDNVVGGGSKTGNKWSITLGDAQYAWLASTLGSSSAKYKFVFTHHVLGTGRGGIEQATLYEWGGKNQNGVDEFAKMRPGWELPIHQLMVKNGVSVFFQGHDHVWATQTLDGVVYQSLPNPADPNYASDQAKAYKTGTVLPSSGRARVTVSSGGALVEYVRSYLPKDATATHPDGEVAYSYTVGGSNPASQSVGTPKAPTTMSHAKSSTVYGYLKPRHTAGTYPVRIQAYRLVSGVWTSHGYTKANASNYSTYTKYSAAVRLPHTGKWRLQAYAPTDSGHIAAWSSGYDYVTVR